jgi:tetratricopeptide (TPR) repeat protein
MPRLWRTLGYLAAALPLLWSASTPAQTAPIQNAPTSLALPPPTSAPASRPPGSADLRRAYDAAFQETLLRPSDAETLTKFANLAVQFGDIEGAVSALERLLLVEGDLPEVKLELGVLYFRLGSREAARTYLEAARSSSEASKEVRDRADTFLKAMTGG